MTAKPQDQVQGLLGFIDAGPSPWHVVDEATSQLESNGFTRLRETETWTLQPGRRYFVVRDGSTLIAFTVGDGLAEGGFHVIGAHTDSPTLRVKPAGAVERAPMATVSVEIYGGPILATFADRDLTLAGRVIARDEEGALHSHLVHFRKPLFRLANPAIHLNRNVNEQGLRFDAQEELVPLLGALSEQVPPQRRFRDTLAEYVGLDSGQILSWELAAADTQPAALFGIDQEYIAAPRLDNLASCHAALTALLGAADDGRPGVNLIALFDHEEVGSESYKGAQGSFLEDALIRIAESLGIDGGRYRQTLAKSLVLSADMAHGFHPAYGRFYENDHQVLVNGGPGDQDQRQATIRHRRRCRGLLPGSL